MGGVTDDHLEERLRRYFAARPAPMARFRCATDGCGNPLLAVYDFAGIPVVVTSMADFRYQLNRRSLELRDGGAPPERFDLPTLGLRVAGFPEPVVHALDAVRWPLAVRCREHSSTHVTRAAVDAELGRYRRTRKRRDVGVHLGRTTAM